jgi:hypothetical protein
MLCVTALFAFASVEDNEVNRSLEPARVSRIFNVGVVMVNESEADNVA